MTCRNVSGPNSGKIWAMRYVVFTEDLSRKAYSRYAFGPKAGDVGIVVRRRADGNYVTAWADDMKLHLLSVSRGDFRLMSPLEVLGRLEEIPDIEILPGRAFSTVRTSIFGRSDIESRG